MGNHFRRILCAGLTLLVVAGCGGPKRGAVNGKATLDGQPVEDGTISFVSTASPPGPSAWGKIAAGSYSIPAGEGPGVGPVKVEVRWSRKTGKKTPAVAPAPAGAMIEETIEAVPPKYNVKSELKAEIKPGANKLNFELKSN